MVVVNICVGSSCFLKGSEEIVELFKTALEENNITKQVVLTGNFCTGKCNREGVTITVDNKTYSGITRDNFKMFLKDKILQPLGL